MTCDLQHTPANRTRLTKAEQTLADLLAAGLQRGFFGVVSIELAIQDGTIQHVRRKIEQIEK